MLVNFSFFFFSFFLFNWNDLNIVISQSEASTQAHNLQDKNSKKKL